jgi:hypothetical protein
MQVKDKFYSYEDLKDAVKRYGNESLLLKETVAPLKRG